MPEIQTVPVRVTYDGKPHTFDIKQEDGVQISYSLTENGSYTQTEMPFYTESGQYKIYLKRKRHLLFQHTGRLSWKSKRLPPACS